MTKTVGGSVRQIPLAGIHESPLNPRRLFEPAALEELATSIRKHGVIQPLVVRQVKGHYELIAGARRLRAAAIARLTAVPVVIREASDDEVLELMLIENLQRADLNAVDECEGYWALVEKSHYTAVRIAESIGKSNSYVSSRMKLRELGAEARAALAEGRITVSVAIELARVPVTQQRRVLKVRTENMGPGQLTVADAKAAIRPTSSVSGPRGVTYDVIAHCWRCNDKLEYDTDKLGRTIPNCRRCMKEIRELQDQVRRLTTQLKGRVAA